MRCPYHLSASYTHLHTPHINKPSLSTYTMSTLRIAVGQMCSSSSLARNARVVTKLIDSALAQNAKVLFLPEAADYLSRDPAHSVQLAQNTHRDFISVIQRKLQATCADAASFFVAVGVHEPTTGAHAKSKVQNNQIWISGAGEIVHRYQKIHLFDVNIPNGPILKESNSVEPGSRILPPFPVSNAHPNFHVGLSICYDIRFPEMASRLRELGANILTYPSAFTTKTGEAHWMELGRARAIDTQCYVVMAAQCGVHDVYADLPDSEEKRKTRVSYGQSLVIGPWGEVLAKGKTYQEEIETDADGDYHELLVADLDLAAVEKVRTDLPVFTHRRPDIYKGPEDEKD